MSSDASDPPEPARTPRAVLLVPLLRAEQALGDPEALATWHDALSNALAPDLPHDLLGLWLFPSNGGAVLLGPEALSQDDLPVPVPAPMLERSQVALVEDIVRDAGYRSVVGAPIRSGRRDVGLLLAAGLEPELYGEDQRLALELAAQQLAPLLGRMARQWSDGGSTRAARVSQLMDAVSQAGRQATSAAPYFAELGRALGTVLPHERIDLLVVDADGARAYRLGEHSAGALWSDPSLTIPREHLDLAALFGGRDTVMIADTYGDSRWPRGYFTVEEPVGAEVRSVVGTRVRGPNGYSTYLLVGSIGADLYDEDDEALLRRLGGLVAGQVGLLVAAAEPPPTPDPVPAPGPSLIDAAELLATGAEFAETTRRVADLAARLIPFDQMRFAIRLSEGDRVVLLEPGERRPLPDLPLIPVAGTTLASVLQGEIPNSFQLVQGEARLLVPLRVSGRIHGALVLTARPPAILREVHIGPAQQLADVVAAHLELLRRTALLPAPFLPGWKKVR
ncbi:MAG: hypothetical protein ACTHM9_11120 [Gemmatimonadales bacterium]